jgi:hypothetical protein
MTEEEATELQALRDQLASSQVSVSKLEANTSKFLEEKKAWKETLSDTERRAAEEEQKRIESAGNLEEIKKFHDSRDNLKHQQQEDEINSLKEQIQKGMVDVAHSGILGNFENPDIGKNILNSSVTIGADGGFIGRDLIGNVVADNQADYVKWLQESDSMKGVLKGSQATGGGATGSLGSRGAKPFGSGDKSYLKMSLKEQVAYLKSNIDKG